MPRKAKKKPTEGERLPEKEEDKAWKKWFGGLSEKEHDKYLAQLGLDKEEIDEWHEDVKEQKSKKSKKEEE